MKRAKPAAGKPNKPASTPSPSRRETDNDAARPLKNSRHEAFCRNLIKGMSQSEAYKAAGYKEPTARINASALLTCPNIHNRLDHLKSQAANSAVISRQELLELHTLAIRKRFAALARYVNVTPDGDVAIEVDPEQIKNDPSIKKVTVRVDTSGKGDGKNDARFVSMEFHDYAGVAEQITKLEGWNAPVKTESKIDLEHVEPFCVVTDSDEGASSHSKDEKKLHTDGKTKRGVVSIPPTS